MFDFFRSEATPRYPEMLLQIIAKIKAGQKRKRPENATANHIPPNRELRTPISIRNRRNVIQNLTVLPYQYRQAARKKGCMKKNSTKEKMLYLSNPLQR